MRERHFPRICANCHAPMARQEDSCWACGAPAPAPEHGRRPAGAVTMTSARFTPAEIATRRTAAAERATSDSAGVRPQPARADSPARQESAS